MKKNTNVLGLSEFSPIFCAVKLQNGSHSFSPAMDLFVNKQSSMAINPVLLTHGEAIPSLA
jgi:hypothetical protein